MDLTLHFRAECSEKTKERPNARGLTPFGKVRESLVGEARPFDTLMLKPRDHF